MPLKVLQLPEDMEETWERVERFLDGLEEICEMVGVGTVSTWKVGSLFWRDVLFCELTVIEWEWAKDCRRPSCADATDEADADTVSEIVDAGA